MLDVRIARKLNTDSVSRKFRTLEWKICVEQNIINHLNYLSLSIKVRSTRSLTSQIQIQLARETYENKILEK